MIAAEATATGITAVGQTRAAKSVGARQLT